MPCERGRVFAALAAKRGRLPQGESGTQVTLGRHGSTRGCVHGGAASHPIVTTDTHEMTRTGVLDTKLVLLLSETPRPWDATPLPHAVARPWAAVTKQSHEQACPIEHVQKTRPKQPWLGAHMPRTINNCPLETPLLHLCSTGCHCFQPRQQSTTCFLFIRTHFKVLAEDELDLVHPTTPCRSLNCGHPRPPELPAQQP